MSTALWIAVACLVVPYELWVRYVAVMRLKMIRDAGQLTAATEPLAYLTLAQGLVLDLVVNVIAGTALFGELPREWTLSARLTRLSTAGGWRQRRAVAIRAALLDHIDPAGVHTG